VTIAPNEGPCSPWITETQVAALPQCQGYDESDCADAAAVASEILYRLSGKLWTGACGPVTVRPICRPHNTNERAWGASMGLGIMAYGMCGGMTAGANIAGHYGHSHPPEVDLGVFPVTEIISVLINGEEIPSEEYQLQDYRKLVRTLPTDTSVPTEMWGWPTAQRLDLPDTQQDTFSVTYMYGNTPPIGGIRAALTLAYNLAQAYNDDPNDFPIRTTSVQRQGVSQSTTDVEDIVQKGLTGIYQVDLWINSVNPGGQKFKSQVWTPDAKPARRMPRGVS
jgi:hypothetical protein